MPQLVDLNSSVQRVKRSPPRGHRLSKLREPRPTSPGREELSTCGPAVMVEDKDTTRALRLYPLRYADFNHQSLTGVRCSGSSIPSTHQNELFSSPF